MPTLLPANEKNMTAVTTEKKIIAKGSWLAERVQDLEDHYGLTMPAEAIEAASDILCGTDGPCGLDDCTCAPAALNRLNDAMDAPLKQQAADYLRSLKATIALERTKIAELDRQCRENRKRRERELSRSIYSDLKRRFGAFPTKVEGLRAWIAELEFEYILTDEGDTRIQAFCPGCFAVMDFVTNSYSLTCAAARHICCDTNTGDDYFTWLDTTDHTLDPEGSALTDRELSESQGITDEMKAAHRDEQAKQAAEAF